MYQVVVPCTRRIQVYGVVHGPVARTCILVRIHGSRRVRRVVLLRYCRIVVLCQSVEFDKVVQRSSRDDLARRILDRFPSIVHLRQRVLYRHGHIALQDCPLTVCLHHLRPRFHDDVPVVLRSIYQVVGNILRRARGVLCVIRRRVDVHPTNEILVPCSKRDVRMLNIALDILILC